MTTIRDVVVKLLVAAVVSSLRRRGATINSNTPTKKITNPRASLKFDSSSTHRQLIQGNTVVRALCFLLGRPTSHKLLSNVFTALHGMPTRGLAMRILSVYPFVRQTRAL